MTTGTHWASVDQRQDGAPGAYLPGIWKSDWAVGRGFGVERNKEQKQGEKKVKQKQKDITPEKHYGKYIIYTNVYQIEYFIILPNIIKILQNILVSFYSHNITVFINI